MQLGETICLGWCLVILFHMSTHRCTFELSLCVGLSFHVPFGTVLLLIMMTNKPHSDGVRSPDGCAEEDAENDDDGDDDEEEELKKVIKLMIPMDHKS